MTEQIKSRERVALHGEVFTNEREVNAMLDLVKAESERIDSRFLEPACGNGSFVIEILNRKLLVAERKYRKSPTEYEKYSIVAVSSVYGVDILEDNAKECRQRLYDFWNAKYTAACKKECREEVRDAAEYIINHNILCGDALTMLCDDGDPIVFAQWDLIHGSKIKRKDYRLDSLMKADRDQPDLFENQFSYDEESMAWIPAPIREYPLMNYWEVQYAD